MKEGQDHHEIEEIETGITKKGISGAEEMKETEIEMIREIEIETKIHVAIRREVVPEAGTGKDIEGLHLHQKREVKSIPLERVTTLRQEITNIRVVAITILIIIRSLTLRVNIDQTLGEAIINQMGMEVKRGTTKRRTTLLL